MSPVSPLGPERLYRRIDPASLSFATTAELEPLSDVFGQDRAIEAVEFGMGIRRVGYNMYALGEAGMGRHDFVRRHIARRAEREPVPADWCYINNFSEPHKPKVLRLPAGKAVPLRDDVAKLIEEVRAAIAGTFESDDYRARREGIDNAFKERHEKALEGVQARAQEKNIALIRTPMGLGLAPVREGEVLNPEEFRKLPQEDQERIRADIAELEHQLASVMRQAPQWQREHREQVRTLDREMTENAVSHLIEELRHRYQDLPQVLPYLIEVQDDIIENVTDFLPGANTPQQAQEGVPPAIARRMSRMTDEAALRRYRVNVLVDHRGDKGAPIVYEDNPTHPNLIGRIEHEAQFGALFTDFNLIKPGALHRANGGYLLLDVRKVLMQPFAWEELKRALRASCIRVDSLAEQLGIMSTQTLQPEPIPLDVKVVLIGDRQLYYMLAQLDPDFPELFKVPVDFAERIELTDENALLFARMLGAMAKRENLRPLDAPAAARVIERAARLAGDSERLTTHMRSVSDILREADYWAHKNGRQTVTAEDVQQAIDAKEHRLDRIRERSLEEIERRTILIDTDGAKVGQVNGLAVLQMGELSFGRPSRITARVRLGRGEFVDIEREVALGGPLHSKGVLILAGFLGERFGHDHPLALSASLVFEQSYGGVDGDSASSTEAYALLSALSGVPIRQCFAVTGSVNQRGEVQPIGGVNEKIEGFFDVCRARGLDGHHGVLIPASNVKHLMLRHDVVEACAAGRFHIYPVETIDQGIEILTGAPAGEQRADGSWPDNTVNGRAAAQLVKFAENLRRFGPLPARGSNS